MNSSCAPFYPGSCFLTLCVTPSFWMSSVYHLQCPLAFLLSWITWWFFSLISQLVLCYPFLPLVGLDFELQLIAWHNCGPGNLRRSLSKRLSMACLYFQSHTLYLKLDILKLTSVMSETFHLLQPFSLVHTNIPSYSHLTSIQNRKSKMTCDVNCLQASNLPKTLKFPDFFVVGCLWAME